MKASVALVDDHILIRNGMAALLQKLGYEVPIESDNGIDFLEKLKTQALPDIVLMDIQMPEMDGYTTTLWLKKNYPTIKVLALSMYDNEKAILRMIRSGAKGYILKDAHPFELETALHDVFTKGFYQSEVVTGKLIHSVNKMDSPENTAYSEALKLTNKELEFLKFVCTEFTYKEIADKMQLSPRTIDGYREDLFQKLNLKSRVGLVLFAIKEGFVSL